MGTTTVDRPAPGLIQKSPVTAGMAVVCAIALAKFLLHLYFNNRYGYFRDEFDYMSCGDHLAWGYVDQPPLIPFLIHISRAVLGDSLRAIRFIPALTSSLLVVQAALIASSLHPAKMRSICPRSKPWHVGCRSSSLSPEASSLTFPGATRLIEFTTCCNELVSSRMSANSWSATRGCWSASRIRVGRFTRDAIATTARAVKTDTMMRRTVAQLDVRGLPAAVAFMGAIIVRGRDLSNSFLKAKASSRLRKIATL